MLYDALDEFALRALMSKSLFFAQLLQLLRLQLVQHLVGAHRSLNAALSSEQISVWH
jgi:hypothetical protein